jgi:hypothetical protein
MRYIKETGGEARHHHRQTMTAAFTCPDGFTYQAPAGFPFATFRKNWCDEWELDNFHSTESSAKEAICQLLAAKIPVALRVIPAT